MFPGVRGSQCCITMNSAGRTNRHDVNPRIRQKLIQRVVWLTMEFGTELPCLVGQKTGASDQLSARDFT
jgi:hypothetical protein